MKFRILLLLFLGFGCFISAQTPSPALPSDPEVRTGQLRNGLKYYILKNTKPEKKVELRLVVNAGSMMEDEDQLGLAHFMEHMNFNGLKHFPHNEVVHYLQSIGVKFGADLNAYTSFDETVYILPVPAAEKGKLDTAFTILADWAAGALLDDKEIEAEKGVVLEESRLGKGADDRLFKQWFPKYMNGSRYAKRLPIGVDSIVAHVNHEALRRFYHDWYRPNLECVVVVGDIDQTLAEEMIKEKFGGLVNPVFERTRTPLFDMPLHTQSKAIVLSDPEAQDMEIQIFGNSYRSKAAATEADFKEKLIQNLFSTMLAERYDELKNAENPPFVYGASFLETGYGRGWDDFSSFAICGNEQAQAATQALVREAMRVKKFGFTAGELQRAKVNYLSGFEHRFKEKDKTESGKLANELIRKFLSNAPAPGIVWSFHFTEKLLPTIALSEVNAMAKKISFDNNYFAVLTAKTNKLLPNDSIFKKWIDEALQEEVRPYLERKFSSQLLEKSLKGGNILKTAKDSLLKTITYSLSNGAKVTIKPTSFKNDQIELRAERFGGYSLYGAKDFESGQYCNNVVEEMGYGSFSNTDLNKTLNGKVVNVNTYVDTYTDVVEGSCAKGDMKTFFELLYLKQSSPRKDMTGFRSFINREKQEIESLKANPENLFFDTISNILYEGNPIARYLASPADFDKINVDHAIAFYNSRFNSAYGMHYFIAGNFTEDEIKPLIEHYIGALSGKKIALKYNDLHMKRAVGKHSLLIKKGTEQKSLMVMFLYGPASYNSKEAFEIKLLNEVLNNKIVDTLREKMGAIYGGGASVELTKVPYQEFTFSAYLPCAPQNVDAVEKAFDKLVLGMQTTGGITHLDLLKAKEASKATARVRLTTNDYWLNTLSHAQLYNEDPDELLHFEQMLDAVTVEDLTRLAKKYMNSDNLFKGLLMPENH